MINSIDWDRRVVVVDATEFVLPERQWQLFRYLMDNRGKVVTHSDLLQHMQGLNQGYNRGALDGVLAGLRKNLGTKEIRTYGGRGYRLALSDKFQEVGRRPDV